MNRYLRHLSDYRSHLFHIVTKFCGWKRLYCIGAICIVSGCSSSNPSNYNEADFKKSIVGHVTLKCDYEGGLEEKMIVLDKVIEKRIAGYKNSFIYVKSDYLPVGDYKIRATCYNSKNIYFTDVFSATIKGGVRYEIKTKHLSYNKSSLYLKEL